MTDGYALQSILAGNAGVIGRGAGLKKRAYQPMPPQDPNMMPPGGMPPEMGGMPPEMMQGGMPPEMGGMPMMVAEMPVDEFKQMLREVVADVMTGGDGGGESADPNEERLSRVEQMLEMMAGALGLPDPEAMGGDMAPQGPPMMGPPGAGMPAMGMEQQASAVGHKPMSLADMIISHSR